MEHLQNAKLHENINSVTFGDSLESVNKPKPTKEVCPYMPMTCSDRHIRTFFSGFGGTDNLLWLTRERQVVGCTYYNSAFNKKQKAQVVKAVVP